MSLLCRARFRPRPGWRRPRPRNRSRASASRSHRRPRPGRRRPGQAPPPARAVAPPAGPVRPRGRSGQRAAEQRGVLQCRVGPRTTGRAHRVDGVAEHGDPAGRPRRHGPRGADPDQERLVDGGLRVQRAQVRVPGPDQRRRQRVQVGRRHRGQLLVRDPELPAVSRHGPHQVVLGGREPRRGLFRPLPEADQPGRHADTDLGTADHRGEAVPERGRQPVQDGGPERGLAVDAPLAGIGRRGGGQVLPAHRRVDAVGADQQIRLGLPCRRRNAAARRRGRLRTWSARSRRPACRPARRPAPRGASGG